MSGDDYSSGQVLQSPTEREAVQRAIEAARRADELRAGEQAEEERRRAQAQARLAAARPLGERLLERHCTGCHTLEPVLAVRHSWLGWQTTVARMRWWNGASVPGEAVGPIVDHLLTERPAAPGRMLAEYATPFAALAAVAGWPLFGRLRRRVAHPANNDDSG